MEAFVKNIDTVKKYLKVMALAKVSAMPDFEAAQKRYLLPILGKALFAIVQAEAITVPAQPSDLLKLVYRALIPLAYYLDLPSMQTQINDIGVGVTTTDNFTPAARWAFLELREMLADKGCAGLEELLIFLNEDKPNDVDWTLPDGYNSIIKTGKDFSRYFTIYQPYRTFENLRPIITSVEDEKIRPAIGDVFFERLRDATTPAPEEKKAIELVKKAVAYFAITKGCALLPVRLGSDGFTVALDRTTDMTNQGQQQAPAVQMSVLSNTSENIANGYLDTLLSLLNKTASTTIYPLFFTSEFYKVPVVPSVSEAPFNSTSNAFFL